MMPRSQRRLAAALEGMLYVAWTAVLLWPVTADPFGRAVGEGDARTWMWQSWALARVFKRGELPVEIDAAMAPYGLDILPADGALPTYVGMAWNLIASPMLANNLAVAMAVLTNALAGRYIGAQVSGRRWVRVLCALAFMTAPALTIRLDGHYNLLFAFPVGLLLAECVRVTVQRSRLRVGFTAVALALAYASSGYYFVFGAVAVVLVLVLRDVPVRDRIGSLVRFGTAGMLAVVLLLPLLGPKLALERRELAAGAARVSGGATEFSADVASAVLPAPGTALSVGPLADLHLELGPNRLENTSFPGLLGLAGIAGLLVLRSPLRRPLVGAAAGLWVLSLGPTARVLGESALPEQAVLPMAALLELPGMSGVRAPNRASFVLVAVAVACLAATLSFVAHRTSRAARVVVVVVALASLAASTRVGINWTDELTESEVRPALVEMREEADRGDAVIHLPDDCLNNANQIAMQIEHRLPVVGCHGFDAATPWRTGLPGYFSSAGWAALRCAPQAIASRPTPFPGDLLPSPAAAAELQRELNVRYVVFEIDNDCPDRGQLIRAALVASGEVLVEGESFLVIDLEG